ncbi:MAG TPA: hypothetical protein VNL35_17265 [Chloroflexota bacterium]|nr:hypothetical protein [Chloroflexota bacterium]
MTNELDPERLPVLYAVALYGQGWRIEATDLVAYLAAKAPRLGRQVGQTRSATLTLRPTPLDPCSRLLTCNQWS